MRKRSKIYEYIEKLKEKRKNVRTNLNLLSFLISL